MGNRYARQELVEGWNSEVIKNARILVVGAGTTGNEVIKNLALLGIGHITILDYDVIEEVNLNRSVLFSQSQIGQPKAETAAEMALRLNPELEIIGRTCDVNFGSQAYKSFDVVILTVDNFEARKTVNRYCWRERVPVLDTGIHALAGNIYLSIPPHGACVECGWDKKTYDRLYEKYSCLKLGITLEDKKIPMVVTTAAIIGGLAVQELTRYLHVKAASPKGKLPKDFVHKAYYYVMHDFQVLNFINEKRINPECQGHVGNEPEKRTLKKQFSLDTKVEDLTRKLAASLKADSVELFTDKDIVYQTVCRHCAAEKEIPPTYLGRFKRAVCPECGYMDLEPLLRTDQLLPGFTLKELGIPSKHRLKAFYSKNGSIEHVCLDTL